MFENIWKISPLEWVKDDIWFLPWYYNYKNNNWLSFIPDWATSDEVVHILEFSFSYLIENKENLTKKFWWKWFWLLLAKSLSEIECFWENTYSVPNFHLIPTDFYQFEKKIVTNSNDINEFENYLNEINNFGPNQKVSKLMKNLINELTWFEWRVDTKTLNWLDNDNQYIEMLARWYRLTNETDKFVQEEKWKATDRQLWDTFWDNESFVVYNDVWWFCKFNYKQIKNKILVKYLTNNENILVYILKNLSVDTLLSKWSFLLDIYLEFNWLSSYNIEDVNWCKRISFYKEINWKKQWWWSSGLSYLINEIQTSILEYFWKIKRKNNEKELLKDNEKYNEYLNYINTKKQEDPNYDYLNDADFPYNDYIYNLSISIPYITKEDLKEQKEVYLWKTTIIDFTKEQESYLKKIFDSFSYIPYIAIRSSADIEDAWDRNYSWVFYSGFCSTSDFFNFKQIVKKVLQSAKNVSDINVNMWIVIMEVSWIERRNYYWDLRFYPDWGWVMATTNFWDRVSISAELWLPIWVTSWNNEDSLTLDFNKQGEIIQACIKEYSSHNYYIVENISCLTDWKVENIIVAKNLTPLNRNICWIFDMQTYKKLINIWNNLEEMFWYPLDIEFAVTNWAISILQIRKFPDKYKRPDNMTEPNIDWKKILLEQKDTLATFGYINNERLFLKNITLSYWWWSVGQEREHDNQILINTLNELESNHKWEWYALIINKLNTFPNLNIKNYPWLSLVVFRSDDYNYKLSHAYMMLRELWIPTIICNDDWFVKLHLENEKYANVYIDWSNWVSIYY